MTFQQTFDPADLLASVDLANVRRYLEYTYGTPLTTASAHENHLGKKYYVHAHGVCGSGPTWKEAIADLDNQLTSTQIAAEMAER